MCRHHVLQQTETETAAVPGGVCSRACMRVFVPLLMVRWGWGWGGGRYITPYVVGQVATFVLVSAIIVRVNAVYDAPTTTWATVLACIFLGGFCWSVFNSWPTSLAKHCRAVPRSLPVALGGL